MSICHDKPRVSFQTRNFVCKLQRCVPLCRHQVLEWPSVSTASTLQAATGAVAPRKVSFLIDSPLLETVELLKVGGCLPTCNYMLSFPASSTSSGRISLIVTLRPLIAELKVMLGSLSRRPPRRITGLFNGFHQQRLAPPTMSSRMSSTHDNDCT